MKKDLFWTIVTLILSILTMYICFFKSGLSFQEFVEAIKHANVLWLIPAVLCMFCFIWFEGHSLTLISRSMGYPVQHRKGFLYASADIYFSSITPSATGGQPASAYFMYIDGLPAEVVTAALILNLTMYTLAIITLGLLSVLFFPSIFFQFPLSCKVMILFGIVSMVLLTLSFIILLKKKVVLLKISSIIFYLLRKLHFKALSAKLETRFNAGMEKYNLVVEQISGKTGLLSRIFFLNLLQRTSQILVPVFVYFALHGNYSNWLMIFVIQCYVVVGSNFIPMPGAVGISEFIMFFGYSMLMDNSFAIELAVASRGISFYTCSIVSLITVILGYIFIRFIKNRRKSEVRE
ncbi:MAG: flippase-like domain-containing protein [Spirochaetia bacterium]|nr:flippase-like domain-containing protein [Spirochaetia bacterium]MBR4436660.1 flippase-like domain-containing protein [Spirochaetales bacterium]MBR5915663.1 flippase-like domain-containing protein [Spirochaetia bacterium]